MYCPGDAAENLVPRLTIGTDIDTAEVLEEMGAEHVPCPVDDIVVDEDNKIVTTGIYAGAEHCRSGERH